jgi:hypothetical protein
MAPSRWLLLSVLQRLVINPDGLFASTWLICLQGPFIRFRPVPEFL